MGCLPQRVGVTWACAVKSRGISQYLDVRVFTVNVLELMIPVLVCMLQISSLKSLMDELQAVYCDETNADNYRLRVPVVG